MATPGEFWENFQTKHAEIEARAAAKRRHNAQLFLLENLRMQYRCSRNPLCVWSAWGICQRGGHVLPDWVTGYLNQFAETVRSWIDKPPRRALPTEVGAALGFGAKTKDRNPLTMWRELLEGERWFNAYEENVLAGVSAKAARQKVAEGFGRSEPTVRRRLDAFAASQATTVKSLLERRARLRKELCGGLES